MVKPLIVCFFLLLSGCASAPVAMAPAPKPAGGMPGTYHRVEKGQTLWRISKMYNIDLEELAKANQITDTTDIEVNQQIFIPKQKKEACIIVGNEDDFMWPLKGQVIGSFGQVYRNLINKGINIRASAGQSVIASRSGKVVFYSPNFKGYGKTIIIDHGDGFSTVYAKNSQVLVKPGETVSKGSAIATIDGSGGSKNSYLHFEIRKGYAAQNPHFYLSK
jgi:lipoprotein YgeR